MAVEHALSEAFLKRLQRLETRHDLPEGVDIELTKRVVALPL